MKKLTLSTTTLMIMSISIYGEGLSKPFENGGFLLNHKSDIRIQKIIFKILMVNKKWTY